MASVHPCIGVAIIQPPGMAEEVVESSAPCIGGKAGISCCILRCTTIFKIEHADLEVAGAGDDGSVARVGHEFDAEDVGMVASAYTRIESKRLCQIRWIVIPDVEICVIRAGCKEVAAFGPTAIVSNVQTKMPLSTHTSEH